MFECVMVISISMRPGGPFVKPRRVTYFALYLVLILAAAGVTWLETWIDRKKQADYRLYFRAEAVFLGFSACGGWPLLSMTSWEGMDLLFIIMLF